MVRPADQVTPVIEEVACQSQLPGRGRKACHAGPHGEAPGSLRGQREQRAMRPGASALVSMGRERQGGVDSLQVG